MIAGRLPHTVAFTVLRDEDRTAAYAAIAYFGKAISVEETENNGYVNIVAVCATQRGEEGACQLHSIGCDYRALPYIR